MEGAHSGLDRPLIFPVHKGYSGHHRSGSTPTIGSLIKHMKDQRGDYAKDERPAFIRTLTPGYDRLTRKADTTNVPHKTIKKIACLGSGFVGGPTSAVTAFKTDIEVTVVDINKERITAWNSKNLPIYEPGLDEIVRAARDGYVGGNKHRPHNVPGSLGAQERSSDGHARRPNLFFSTDVEQAISDADLIFVCVNTPTKSNGIGKGAAADLGFVEAATRQIAKVARESKIVVEKSTVPCRTSQSMREILEANAQQGVQFDVLSNPEFLAEGTAIRDLLHPDRVIIGSVPNPAGFRAAASLADIYAHWVPRDRIITMNLWSSELSKLAANAMLAQRISSVNALSAICEATGADVDEVSYACGLDSRIGPRMLKAGPGFGGSCFQKDVFNIVYLSESLHLYEVADYWRAIINMNEHQKERFTKRIISCLFNNLTGKKIAVLGFAFKKDTSDTRESPAITFVSNFVAEGAQVAIYDPKVKEAQIWKDLMDDGGDFKSLTLKVEVCRSAYAACTDADAVVLLTEWDEFSNKSSPSTSRNAVSTPALTEMNPDKKPSVTSSLQTQTSKPQTTPLFATKVGRVHSPSSCTTANPEPLTNLNMTNDERLTERLDWGRVATGMRKPMFVFDGRNILDRTKLESLGFRVEAIGKAGASTPTCYE